MTAGDEIEFGKGLAEYVISTDKQISSYRAALKEAMVAITEAQLAYTAILMDAASRNWIAPEVWDAIEKAQRKGAAMFEKIDALLGGECGDGTD